MGMMLKVRWNVVFNGALDRVHVFAGANAGAVADAEDMGVDSLSRHAPPHVQHHIGGFAPHARQGLQGCA